MEIVEGLKRFSKKYIDNSDYGYRINRSFANGKLFLRCCEENCRGTGVYNPKENIFKPKIKHSHEPNIEIILVWRFLHNLKERVEGEDASLFTLYQEESLKFTGVELPSFPRLKSTLWKRRQLVKSIKNLNCILESDGDSHPEAKDEQPLDITKYSRLLEPGDVFVVDGIPEENFSVHIQHDPSNQVLSKDMDDLLQIGEHSHFQSVERASGNVIVDEEQPNSILPPIFNEFDADIPIEGSIVEIMEGPKRFSRVFIDDIGYGYQVNKKRKEGTVLLRCHKCGCSGSGIFYPKTSSFRRLAKHLHNPIQNDVTKMRFLNTIKLRAEKEDASLNHIYSEEAEKYLGVPLPSFDKVRSTLRKRRVAAFIPRCIGDDQPNSSKLYSELENELVATHFIDRRGMDIIEGPKRFSKIYIDDRNYCYLVNKKKEDGSMCLRCYEGGCRGSGRFDPGDSVFSKTNKHSHYPDLVQLRRWRFLHQCKMRAENETTPIKTIYQEESDRYPDTNLPPYKKIESTLHKRRRSKRLKSDEKESSEKDHHGPRGNKSSQTHKLEVQLEEVYHPEGSPHYFISPNLAMRDVGSCSRNNPDLVASIKVRTGIQPPSNMCDEKLDQKNKNLKQKVKPKENRKADPGECSGMENKSRPKKIEEKGRRRNMPLSKMKKGISKPFKPRIRESSRYTSKMVVMEGAKRFSKIFIDEERHVYRRTNRPNRDGSLILSCFERGCFGAGVYFPSQEFFKRSAEHIHSPSSNIVAKCSLLSNLKSRAENETGSLRTIYEEEVAKHPDISIPSFRKMESTLLKRRRANIPSEPKTFYEAAFVFQGTNFPKCSKGNFFRQYLNVDATEILIFISPGVFENKLSEIETFHLNNNFKILPHGCARVVVIHLVLKNHMFPVVYALLTSKSVEAYGAIFHYLKNEIPGFDPRFVSSDFEVDETFVFSDVYPNSNITGCWFYYTQAIWRYMRTCDLAQIFHSSNGEAKSILKCIMALPLLPSAMIEEGVRFIRDEITQANPSLGETKISLNQVMGYVEDEWLKRVGEDKLSTYRRERELNYEIEFLHSLYIKRMGVEPPTLIRFIEKMIHLDSLIQADFHQVLSSKPIRSSRSRRNAECEKLLKETYKKLESNILSVDEFLSVTSAVVPRHCLYDDVVCDFDEESIVEDPSDIPDSQVFCEIQVSAPKKGESDTTFVDNGIESYSSKEYIDCDMRIPIVSKDISLVNPQFNEVLPDNIWSSTSLPLVDVPMPSNSLVSSNNTQPLVLPCEPGFIFSIDHESDCFDEHENSAQILFQQGPGIQNPTLQAETSSQIIETNSRVNDEKLETIKQVGDGSILLYFDPTSKD